LPALGPDGNIGFMKIALSGGGTGGHVYPLLAIAESLHGGEFLYIGTRRGAEAEMVKRMRFVAVSAAPFPASPWDIPGFFRFFLKLIPGVLKAWRVLGKFRPRVLISSGGYVSVPAVLAAKLRGIPVILHEQNIVAGRANRVLSRLASAVAVSFPETKQVFPARAYYTGYPLRKRIKRIPKEEARDRLGLPREGVVILAFGGSRGARNINEAMAELSTEFLRKGWRVLHSCGIGTPGYRAFEETVELLKKKGTWGSPSYLLRRFIEDMENAYSAADVVVCRAGAGAVEELRRVRKPAVLVPKMGLPAEHQFHNAMFFKKIGAGEVVVEGPRGVDPKKLLAALERAVANRQRMEEAYSKMKVREPEISFGELVREVTEREPGFARRVFSSALGVSISRVFGFLREVFIGGYFGTSLATDIFAVALTVASFFRRVVGENAMDNAFLPSFLKAKERGRGRSLAMSVLLFFLLATALIVLILELTLPHWFHYIAPGFVKKGVLKEGITLTRLMLPYLLFVTVIGWAGAILKGNNRFATAEGSSALYSVGIILGLLLFYGKFSFYSLGIGFLLGGVLQSGFLLANLKQGYMGKGGEKGLRWDPGVLTVALLTLPILLDVSFSRLSDVVDKILATPLQDGTVAALYFAAIFFRLPANIIGNSINNVVLRDFSHNFHKGDVGRASEVVHRGFRYHFVFLLPATVFTFAFARPIIAVVFQRGAFGTRALQMTSAALSFYSLGILAWGLSAMAGKLFAARMETHLSMWTNALAISLNVALSIILVRKMGYTGLALATSLSLYFAVALRFFILNKRMKKDGVCIKWREIFVSLVRWGLGAVFSVASGYLFYRLFSGISLGSRFFANLFALSVSLTISAVFLLVYYFITRGGNGSAPAGKGRRGELTKEEVEALLLSPSWEKVNRGVKLVGEMGLEEFRPVLERLLREGNGFIRRNSAASLGKLPPAPSTLEALRAAASDPYFEVRSAVAEALGNYPEGKEVLLALLRDKWFEVKEKAIISLAKTGGREVLPTIRPFYQHINYRLRLASVEALLILRDRGVITGEEARKEAMGVIVVSEGFQPRFPIREKIARLMEEG